MRYIAANPGCDIEELHRTHYDMSVSAVRGSVNALVKRDIVQMKKKGRRHTFTMSFATLNRCIDHIINN